MAGLARVTFADGDAETRPTVLSKVVLNLGVEGGHIASCQYKDPFGILVRDSSGVFEHSRWAILYEVGTG